MRVIHLVICLCLLAGAFSQGVTAADQSQAKPNNSFIYCGSSRDSTTTRPGRRKIRLAVDRHFARLKHSIETGELILAGRTGKAGDKTLGIAIFMPARTRRLRVSSWEVIRGSGRRDERRTASIHGGFGTEEPVTAIPAVYDPPKRPTSNV
jgi:hypothetical protein